MNNTSHRAGNLERLKGHPVLLGNSNKGMGDQKHKQKIPRLEISLNQL